MDWHKYQKLLYWKDFVMNCFCFQIFCDHLIVMRYFVMGDHVMAINVPVRCTQQCISLQFIHETIQYTPHTHLAAGDNHHTC